LDPKYRTSLTHHRLLLPLLARRPFAHTFRALGLLRPQDSTRPARFLHSSSLSSALLDRATNASYILFSVSRQPAGTAAHHSRWRPRRRRSVSELSLCPSVAGCWHRMHHPTSLLFPSTPLFSFSHDPCHAPPVTTTLFRVPTLSSLRATTPDLIWHWELLRHNGLVSRCSPLLRPHATRIHPVY
jgi:hypothetical protein